MSWDMDLTRYFHRVFSTPSTKTKTKTDPDIIQGKQLRDNRLQIASNELREGFANSSSSSSSSNDELLTQAMNSIHQMEDDYQTKVNELNELVASYNQSLAQVVSRMTSSIAGKNIQIGETVYYINQYGFARKYGLITGDVWINRNSTCGGSTPIIQEVPLEKLDVVEASPMKASSICGYEGKNVKYQSQFAYVKLNGDVVLYASGVKVGDVAGCPTQVVDITSHPDAQVIWSGLMADQVGTLDTTTTCVDELNPTTEAQMTVRDEINQKQAELLEMSRTIRDQIKVLQTDLGNIEAQTDHQQTLFGQYITELNTISQKHGDQDTLQAMVENTFMIERQSYLKYIAYAFLLLLCFGLLYFLGKSVGGVTSQVAQTVQNVGEEVKKYGVGAPRQSVLRREMEGASALGGVGFKMPSLGIQTPSVKSVTSALSNLSPFGTPNRPQNTPI